MASMPSPGPVVAGGRELGLEPPSGLTGFYRFETLTGYGFTYAWVVENPSGRISGAVFLPHPTGFLDVIPIAEGRAPGRRRDFDFTVGCVEFDGWSRSDGALAGDIRSGCEDTQTTEFLARQVASDPDKTGPLEGFKLFRLRETGQSLDSAGGWLVIVGPKGFGEGTVAALHIWGRSVGPGNRRDLLFPRGEAGRTSGRFQTVNRSVTLTVDEAVGAVTATLGGPNGDPILQYDGFRHDLLHCLDAENSRSWPTVASLQLDVSRMRDSLKAAEDSIGAAERRITGQVRPGFRVIPDSASAARARARLPDLEALRVQRVEALEEAERRLEWYRHAITNLRFCPNRPGA